MGFESLQSEGDSGKPSSEVASGSSCSERNGFVRTRRSMGGRERELRRLISKSEGWEIVG